MKTQFVVEVVTFNEDGSRSTRYESTDDVNVFAQTVLNDNEVVIF